MDYFVAIKGLRDGAIGLIGRLWPWHLSRLSPALERDLLAIVKVHVGAEDLDLTGLDAVEEGFIPLQDVASLLNGVGSNIQNAAGNLVALAAMEGALIGSDRVSRSTNLLHDLAELSSNGSTLVIGKMSAHQVAA